MKHEARVFEILHEFDLQENESVRGTHFPMNGFVRMLRRSETKGTLSEMANLFSP